MTGLLIDFSASLLLLGRGQVAGISGILGRLIGGDAGDGGWRAWFVAGLVAVWWVWVLVGGTALQFLLHTPVPMLVLAGLLVGFGSALGSGCTSGHGICGLGNLSSRSASP